MEFFKKISFFRKGLQISPLTSPRPPADIKFKSSYARKHIIKKLSLGLNFSTPSGGVTSPSLKGSMANIVSNLANAGVNLRRYNSVRAKYIEF